MPTINCRHKNINKDKALIISSLYNFQHLSNSDSSTFIAKCEASHLRELRKSVQAERFHRLQAHDALLVLLNKFGLNLMTRLFVDCTNYSLQNIQILNVDIYQKKIYN